MYKEPQRPAEKPHSGPEDLRSPEEKGAAWLESLRTNFATWKETRDEASEQGILDILEKLGKYMEELRAGKPWKGLYSGVASFSSLDEQFTLRLANGSSGFRIFIKRTDFGSKMSDEEEYRPHPFKFYFPNARQDVSSTGATYPSIFKHIFGDAAQGVGLESPTPSYYVDIE